VQSIGSTVVDVTPGNYFELARQTSGSTKYVAADELTWFAIEVVEYRTSLLSVRSAPRVEQAAGLVAEPLVPPRAARQQGGVPLPLDQHFDQMRSHASPSEKSDRPARAALHGLDSSRSWSRKWPDRPANLV
jgi:hypothetical protein